MSRIIEDFPFTTIMALIGALIGLILPSGLDYFTDMKWFNATDPAGTITAAVIGVPVVMLIEVVSGLIGALFMGVIGLIIDGFRGAFQNGGY